MTDTDAAEAGNGGRGLATIAPAKINLTLEVLGRRPDGFHDLASIAVTLALADDVTIQPSAERAVRIRDEQGRSVGVGEDEIIGRTWDLLLGRGLADERAAVEVRKRLPVAGGVGGGSSNAAAFLRLARRYWSIDLPEAEWLALGAAVGSDVPLFLIGGTVLLEGRGERVTPLPDLPEHLAVLLWSPTLPLPAAKTAAMFRALRPAHYGAGAASARLRAAIEASGGGTLPPAGAGGVLAAADAGGLVNTLERVSDEVLPGLRAHRRRVAAASGVTPMLAGAGPSLFVLGDAGEGERRLRQAAARLDQVDGRAWVTRPLGRTAATAVRGQPSPETAPAAAAEAATMMETEG